eukprot:SAG11_NODE_373_length_10031_cov_37.400020_5_plen_63_part_00
MVRTNVNGHACRGGIGHAKHEGGKEEVDLQQSIMRRDLCAKMRACRQNGYDRPMLGPSATTG